MAAVWLAGAALVGACATGGGSAGDDDGGPGPGSGAGGPGGMGGSIATGGGMAGMGGAMPTTSSSSTGTPCEEQPCKLTAPQCGCAAGERCLLNQSGMRECGAEGSSAVGDACGTCQAGGQCLTTQGMAMCRAYCDDDSQCNGPGGLCALEVNDGMGGTWADKFCSENCDPVSGTGCAPATAKCEIGQESDGQMRFFTLCTGSGAGTQGAVCTDTGDCAAGYGCFNAGTLQCLKWCSPFINPTCPGIAVCSAFAPPGILVGTVEYGACL
jgi:hypothetical protein